MVRLQNIAKWGHPDHPSIRFRINSVFSKITVSLFLQIIGRTTRSNLLDEFLEQDGSGDVELQHLSQDILKILISPKLKELIRKYLEILCKLRI